jgi:hypothetical protein
MAYPAIGIIKTCSAMDTAVRIRLFRIALRNSVSVGDGLVLNHTDHYSLPSEGSSEAGGAALK